MTLHQFPEHAQIEGDDYVRGLESRLDRALFDRDGLISQPEAAAWLVRGALAKGDRHRADEVVSATERLAARRPDASVLVLAARHARGVLQQQPTALAEVAGAFPISAPEAMPRKTWESCWTKEGNATGRRPISARPRARLRTSEPTVTPLVSASPSPDGCQCPSSLG